MFYFPHEVTEDMGGTRYIPGTHLRSVHESAIARYQNIRGQMRVVCPAGTIIFFHHGLWHGGGKNTGDAHRIMYKVRMQPSGSQALQWDTSDLNDSRIKSWQRPIFHAQDQRTPDDVPEQLMTPEPWFDKLDFEQVDFPVADYIYGDKAGEKKFGRVVKVSTLISEHEELKRGYRKNLP